MKIWMPTVRAGSGADVYAERLAALLRETGIEVQLDWFPHRTEWWPAPLARRAAPAGTDLIHVNSWTAPAVLGRGLPVVTTFHHLVHDPVFAPTRSWQQAIYHRGLMLARDRRAALASDALVAVSHYAADTVEACFGRRPRVVWNWVDTLRWRPAPQPPRDRGAPMRLLWVGNHSRRKGADLLPALARTLGDGFEIRCTGGLREGRADGVLGGGLTALGRLDENALIAEYQSCDAVISTSRYEGFGYSALDAMSCGKPFVGFAHSGLREVVETGESGLLAPAGDVAALAAACRRLAAEPGLCAALGDNGRRHATTTFGAARAARDHFALCAAALHAHNENRHRRESQ